MYKWFDSAIIYQVYPKSFRDSNNDGVGDIKGIIEKLDYIKSLGVNTIWLNPVFVSPQVDNGYDVSNYFAIDALMGNMQDIEKLIKKVHKMSMKIIIDFVMNHTSDQHPWFQDAINNPHSIYRNYYLWCKGSDDQEPNNWGSFFGGSVWEKEKGGNKEYYFHLFDKHMPDLNWKNPEVQRSMTDIAKYWVSKGIDGLRLDAFIHISKASFKQNSLRQHGEKYLIAEEFYANRMEVRTYLQKFISELKQENPNLYILGEAASATPNLMADYSVKSHNLCDHVISFRLFVDKNIKDDELPKKYHQVRLNLPDFKQNMASIQSNLDGISMPVLYWGNHDLVRVVTRYGNPANINSAKSLAIGMYLQKGIPLIYYGEELGMENAELADINSFNDQEVLEASRHLKIKKQDFIAKLSRVHKMAARFPIQWEDKVPDKFWINGHCTNAKANVLNEEGNDESVLKFYREILKLKMTDLFTKGSEVILQTSDNILGYTRFFQSEEGEVFSNLSEATEEVDIKNVKGSSVLLSCGDYRITSKGITLGPWSSIVLKR